VKSSTVDLILPQIQLIRDDGAKVLFTDELNDGRPVVLNFIYTTCTTICPLASHTFAELQDMLGNERDKVHMLSISIDPEQDTPTVLAKYASKYGAGNQWHFYTGTKDASIAAQMAFNVYLGDKMNSNPVTFIRAAPGKPWIRIDGFAKSEDLFRRLQDMGISKDIQPHLVDD
jgi:protein SCO1/2